MTVDIYADRNVPGPQDFVNLKYTRLIGEGADLDTNGPDWPIRLQLNPAPLAGLYGGEGILSIIPCTPPANADAYGPIGIDFETMLQGAATCVGASVSNIITASAAQDFAGVLPEEAVGNVIYYITGLEVIGSHFGTGKAGTVTGLAGTGLNHSTSTIDEVIGVSAKIWLDNGSTTTKAVGFKVKVEINSPAGTLIGLEVPDLAPEKATTVWSMYTGVGPVYHGDTVHAVKGLAVKTKNGDPDATELPAGNWGVWKHTGTGVIKLWVNDGGSFKSATLS